MEFSQHRKSYTSIGEIYFWTATIHKWQHLLESDFNKQLILSYLKKLADEGLITVYAFVIMPNPLPWFVAHEPSFLLNLLMQLFILF